MTFIILYIYKAYIAYILYKRCYIKHVKVDQRLVEGEGVNHSAQGPRVRESLVWCWESELGPMQLGQSEWREAYLGDNNGDRKDQPENGKHHYLCGLVLSAAWERKSVENCKENDMIHLWQLPIDTSTKHPKSSCMAL